MGETVSAEVLTALSQGMLILTGKERTARLVRHAWDQLQARRDLISWMPARVLSWRSWTHKLWRGIVLEGRANDLLLNRVQEQRVWKRVLTSGFTEATLRGIDSLVDLATDAWQLLCAYEGQQQLRRAAPHLHGDPLQFARWCSTFEDLCEQESLLSGALLEAKLAKQLTSADISRQGGELLLVGFDRVTPGQNRVIRAFRSLGGTASFFQDAPPNQGVLARATTEEEELRGCARWIRNKLQDNPDIRLGIIVNDLDREMETIDSVLHEHLLSNFSELPVPREQLLYEFSLGRPLSWDPIVQTAQNLLRWAVGPLPLTEISQLLLSPYFAFDDLESSARAEFDAQSLSKEIWLRPEGTIGDLLRHLKNSSRFSTRLLTLRQTLEVMKQDQARNGLQTRTFGAWSEWIRAWLSRSQWCETNIFLSSHEYQLRQRWQGALDELATLDFSDERVSIQEALATMDRLLRSTIFAPASRGTPVQILGPLEAAGERFDAVWILRAGELSWPPHASAVSILPWSLQRELEMPATDLEREHDFSRRLTCRLAGCANDVVFSFAHVGSSQIHQRAASVIRDLQLRELSIYDVSGIEASRASIQLERSADITFLPTSFNAPAGGGARTLELQAACGFRAFAELRLGSSQPVPRETGMTNAERGNAVHLALEHLWSSIRSQQKLRAMSHRTRDELVRHSARKSFEKIRPQRNHTWDEAYLEAQETRLAKLLTNWMATELKRPDFTVVAQEERRHICIGPLNLSLRMDRVDLVDGQQVVLDYKTGNVSPSAWLGDRPDSPQVPLYALLATELSDQASKPPLPLGAVGFARIRAGEEMDLLGFEAAPGILFEPTDGSRPAAMDASSFAEQVDRWREVLVRLATAFVQGDARVQPKHYPTTCERCSQRLLCRLDASNPEDVLNDQPSDQNDDWNG